MRGAFSQGSRGAVCGFAKSRLWFRREPFSGFVGSCFAGSLFTGSHFAGSHFAGSCFTSSSFAGSCFVGNSFAGIRFMESRFAGSHFTGTQFRSHFAGFAGSCYTGLARSCLWFRVEPFGVSRGAVLILQFLFLFIACCNVFSLVSTKKNKKL